MTSTSARTGRWTAALAGLALVALLAACTTAHAGGPGASPSDAPTPSPTAPAQPSPTAPATPAPSDPVVPAPSDGGSDAMPITIDLETVNGADVVIDIVDRTGRLADARSGFPTDGASVPAYEVSVENVDARTLRLTWVDFPHDNRLGMWIDEVDGELRLLIVQPEPTEPTDAIALDRVLELEFDRDVDAGAVRTILQDGVDTPA